MENSFFFFKAFRFSPVGSVTFALWALLSIFSVLVFRRFFRCRLLVGFSLDFPVLLWTYFSISFVIT